MLTDRQVKNAGAGMHSDGDGLYLRVSPKGKRVWVMRTRIAGRDVWKTIGVYPIMGLSVARQTLTHPAETLTTSEAVKSYVTKLKVVRPEQVEWLMKDFPSLTATRSDLVSLLQKKSTTSPVMANRMLTRWKDFLNFCLQQGWVQENVLEPVQRRFIGGKEHSRDRVLNWQEISSLADPVLRFILLTGLRPSEAIWVLRNKKTTGIPTKRPDYFHTLPRSHLIQYALKQQLVLPSSHLTLSNKLRRANATYRPHDLRRTFATRLSDLGVMPHVIEKLLGHKMQGVLAVYNHAEYWAERNAAQRVWDKKLISLWRSTAVPSAPVLPPSAGT